MKHLPPPCKGQCGRPVRPPGTNRDDWGGAILQQARGYCPRCYANAPRIHDTTPHGECMDCRRPFRPTHSKIADHPETVARYSGGLCASCWRRDGGTTLVQKARRPENCLDCERPMRPKMRNTDEFPGTVMHDRRGLCTTCWSRARRAGRTSVAVVADLAFRVTPPTPRMDFVDEPEDKGLTRLREERQARKAQAEARRAAAARMEAARARFIASRRTAA